MDIRLVYSLYSVLAVLNGAYLVIYIRQLKQRSFHLMMWALITFSISSCILTYVVEIETTAYFVFAEAWYASNEVLFAIFSVKFWILSR